jgi:NAD(P)H-dependent FMN reductase
MTTHIAVVLGTARTGRASEPVAKWVTEEIDRREDCTAELVDVKDHVTGIATVPPWGKGGVNEEGSQWQEIVQRSDALVLVVPEYNHGYPGELKLLLDSLWEDYTGRPVGLVGVSAGTLGGARVVDHLKPVLLEMRLTPVIESVMFTKAREAFSDDGSIKEPERTEYVAKMTDELTRWADLLRPLRSGEEG